MNCNNCGNPIAPGSTSCSVCGTPVVNNNMAAQPAMQTAQPVQPVPMQQPVQQVQQPVAPAQPVMNQAQPMSAQQYPGVPGVAVPNAQMATQAPVQHPAGPGFNIVAGAGATPTAPKSGGNGMAILIILLLLIALGVGGYFIYDSLADGGSRTEEKDKKDKDDEKDEEKEETIEEKEKRYNENIKFVKEIKLFEKELALVYKNDNAEIVGIDVEVEFYDANGALLGTATDYTYAPGNKEFYVIVSDYDIGDTYATYKSNIKATFVGNFEYLSIPQAELKINDTGEKLTVQYTNTSKKTISSLDTCMVYYNNTEIVQIDCNVNFDIAPEANSNTEFWYSWLKEDGLVYTHYELYADGYIINKNDD